jgi:DNA processing protein
MLRNVLSRNVQTRILIRSQPGYPDRLERTATPPAVLQIAGNAELLCAPRTVALVGARAATAAGLARARALASALAERGSVILSGGAIGIDGAAHAGALEAGGGTVAVLAGDLADPYPSRNHWLFERMLRSGGALVCPFDEGTPIRRWSFLRRNAVLAALADAVVVVEARVRSGSLATARAARALGRVVVAAPGSPGTEGLIAAGAGIAEDADDVLRALGGAPRYPEVAAPEPGGHAAQVLGALDPERAQDVEGVAQLAGLSAATVARVLVALELDGLARPVSGARYVRSSRSGGRD